tara:strand:- start:1004 stop:1840 length:837 start_codon:yes stop_codon:yes gene_type:complete
MNWGIRIAVILVILGGLVWLNWDRFSEENRDHPTQMLEGGVVEQAENLPFIRDTESDQKDRDTYNRNMADTAPIASKLPAFELQASPESLNDSDTQVRSVTEELSPEATEWLKPDEQLRKWALLVAQAAEGNTLYTGRPFTFKLAEFALEERGERYFVSTQNFDRYGVIINVLANLPADKLVAYYRDWYPLLEEAFGELGLPGSFDEQVDSMIERILAVEVLLPPIELKKPTSVTYKFLDPKLEAASQIDKWLWRMGPENTRKIQSFANRLKREFAKN